jgi:hypothetical protein
VQRERMFGLPIWFGYLLVSVPLVMVFLGLVELAYYLTK